MKIYPLNGNKKFYINKKAAYFLDSPLALIIPLAIISNCRVKTLWYYAHPEFHRIAPG